MHISMCNKFSTRFVKQSDWNGDNYSNNNNNNKKYGLVNISWKYTQAEML